MVNKCFWYWMVGNHWSIYLISNGKVYEKLRRPCTDEEEDSSRRLYIETLFMILVNDNNNNLIVINYIIYPIGYINYSNKFDLINWLTNRTKEYKKRPIILNHWEPLGRLRKTDNYNIQYSNSLLSIWINIYLSIYLSINLPAYLCNYITK